MNCELLLISRSLMYSWIQRDHVRYVTKQSCTPTANDAEAVLVIYCGALDIVFARVTLIRLARTGMLSTSALSEAPLFRHILTAYFAHYGR